MQKIASIFARGLSSKPDPDVLAGIGEALRSAETIDDEGDERLQQLIEQLRTIQEPDGPAV